MEVAHIFPVALFDFERDAVDKMPSFWDLLDLFWPGEQISLWKQEVFSDGSDIGVETPANMLTLTNTAHAMRNDGRFALKPLWLSDDRKELQIQFFWQEQVQLNPGASLKPSTVAPSSEKLDKSSDLVFLFNAKGNRVRSGEVITMKTTDVETMPLPSWELLKLQWALQRVAGMAGAAEPISLSDDDDDDDEYCTDSSDVDSCDDDDDDGDDEDDINITNHPNAYNNDIPHL